MNYIKNKKRIINVLISLLISGIYYIFALKEIYRIFDQRYDYQRFRLVVGCFFGYIVLNIIILTVGYYIKNRKKHILFIKHFLIYFGIMSFFLFLSWPGVFKGDEFYVIPTSLQLEVNYIQSLYTNIFYILSLCIIPTVGGITFFQVLIISIITGYIIGNIDKLLKNKKLVYLFYIVLLLPPVIDNNLFTLRTSLICYFLVLDIFELIFYKFDRNKLRLFWAGIISVFVARWRMEFIYVPVFVFIYILLMFKKDLNLKKYGYYSLIIFILYFATGRIELTDNWYTYTAALNPLSVLVQYDDIEQTISKKDLANLEKLITFKKLRKYYDYYNIKATRYSNYQMAGKDKTRFFVSYIKLVLHNPIRFLKARYLTFAATNYPKKTDRISQTGWERFQSQWEMKFEWNDTRRVFDMNKTFKYTKNPLGMNFKKWFVCTLLLRDKNDYTATALGHIFYNIVPPLLISLIMFIIYIIKKDKEKILLLLIILGQFPLIFLTAPASFWMYYMPLYLNLYFILFYYLILKLDKK